MIKHVRQDDRYGCVVACLAMVLDRSYSAIRHQLGSPGNGFTHNVWQRFLAERGFGVQHFYRFGSAVWPLAPWADLHICSVDAGHGDGTHVVVMLGDGTVLDPIDDRPRRLTDYPSVAYIAGIHKVGAAPAELRPEAVPA